MLDSKVITLNFSDNKIPVFKEVKNKPYIPFGEDNRYPDKLLELYNKSAKHNAIINGKANYIFGSGLAPKVEDEAAKQWAAKVNEHGESVNDFVEKLIVDVELFGGFYVECIPTKAGDWLYYPLEYKKVRTNKDGSRFWYKEDWNDNREEAKEWPSFDATKKQTSVFHYTEYRPGVDIYALPGYIGSLNYIESDVEISKHTLTSAKRGWRPTKFIHFFNGEPTEEAKRDITRRLKEKTEGAEGETFLIAFNNDPAKKPQIDDLGSSELTKENFTNIDNLISSNIYAGHQIVSPMLFGVKTEGQLGGNTEMRNAYDIFKNTYASVKQRRLEKVVNFLAQQNGITTPFTFIPSDPIGFEFSEETLLKAAPKSWLMEKMGIDTTKYTDAPIEAPEAPAQNTPNSSLQPNAAGQENMVNDHLKNMTGRQQQQMERIIRKYDNGSLSRERAVWQLKSSLGLSDEDIEAILGPAEEQFSSQYDESQVAEMFSEVGEGREAFEVIQSKKVVFNSDKEAIEDELSVYQTFDLEEAAKDASIGKKVKDITKVIKKLPQIYIKYTYEVIPGEGPAVIPTTRPFCRRMVELSATRLWSRTDIEKISERLGYSVWDRRGGFWNNGGKIEKHCRHYWVRHVVIKKNSN